MAANVPPVLLLIETSGPVGQVGIARGRQWLETRRLEETRRLARDLAPAVAALLTNAELSASPIDAGVVSLGPGSYTGLRVGLMAAKTFAYAKGCRLIGIDTFSILACQAPSHIQRLEVISDGQKGKIYHQFFERDSQGAIRPVGELRISEFEKWKRTAIDRSASLKKSKPEPVWVTGPGLEIYHSALPSEFQAVEESLWRPGLEALLQRGMACYERQMWADVFSIEPIYLRPSSAEEQWRRPSAP